MGSIPSGVWDWVGKLLLVIGAAVAGFVLGPLLTNRWQNHQDALSRRGALVERISNSAGKFLGALQVDAHRSGGSSSSLDSAYVGWQVESEAIHSQIAAYEGDPAAQKWSNYAYDMIWVYYVFKQDGAIRPGLALQRVAAYLHRPISTLDGLLDSPFKADRTINPTHEHALNELVLQLRLKQRMIISAILN